MTYLFSGEILHRDSLGYEQVIRPGDINWMTAGRGIVHSEQTPPGARQRDEHLEGIQCWVALPREHEETEPTFHHHPGKTLPERAIEGVQIRVLVGSAFGMKSPVHSFSDVVYVDIKMPAHARLRIPSEYHELGVYAALGSVRVNEVSLNPKALFVGKVGEALTIEALTEARVMLVGGEVYPEGREIWWNFVSSSKERIEKAKRDWAEGRFPRVPGDEGEFIPLPPEPKPSGTVL